MTQGIIMAAAGGFGTQCQNTGTAHIKLNHFIKVITLDASDI